MYNEYDDYYYFEERRKEDEKSEAALARSFATSIGGAIGIVLSVILFLISRFDVLSSLLAALVGYIFTYKQGWNKAVYIAGAIIIFAISMILQEAFKIARIIYTMFVCVIVAILGGCWKTYDTDSQRNMVMLICFGVTALLGYISWCGMAKRGEA